MTNQIQNPKEKNDKAKENKCPDCEKLKAEKEEWRNKYLRALADYQNFEKRAIEEQSKLQKRANISLLMKLLPFLDSLEKAEVFIKDAGLKMIGDRFLQTLRETGVEELQVMGKEFDPHTAEAVDIVPGDRDNIVVEVTRKGYKFQDMVLRVAQVKVSKKK